MVNNSSVIRNCDVAAGGLEYIVLMVTMVILVMMVKYDDEEEPDGPDLLSLANFDDERGGGGELGCQGGGHQGGEESKTGHSEQFQLLCSTIFRQ